MTSVLPTDAGYYTCKMPFPFEGVTHEITRTIRLETVGKYWPLKTLQHLRKISFFLTQLRGQTPAWPRSPAKTSGTPWVLALAPTSFPQPLAGFPPAGHWCPLVEVALEMWTPHWHGSVIVGPLQSHSPVKFVAFLFFLQVWNGCARISALTAYKKSRASCLMLLLLPKDPRWPAVNASRCSFQDGDVSLILSISTNTGLGAWNWNFSLCQWV